MKLEAAIERLLAGKSLSEKAARELFLDIFSQKIALSKAKTLLLLLAKKGEGAAEITGCLKALIKLEPPRRTDIKGLIDTCGTGGDGSHSINVSTLAAIAAAGAGAKVAKHGNRAITSRTGSSDLLEAFGVKLDAGPAQMVRAIRKYGIGYFHAPFYHPVFGRVQQLRKQISTKTLFNYIGPLANPLKLEGQVIGVSRKEHLELYADVLRKKGIKRALVCHSRDGLDEISTAMPTDGILVNKGRLQKMVIKPSAYGFKKCSSADYSGGSVKVNHRLAKKILVGEMSGSCMDIVVINAAAALFVAGTAETIAEGVGMARQSLHSGRAYASLKGLVRISRGQD